MASAVTASEDKRARLRLKGSDEVAADATLNERDEPEAFWLSFEPDADELLPVEAGFSADAEVGLPPPGGCGSGPVMDWIQSAKYDMRWYTPGFLGRAHPSTPQLMTPI